MRPFFIIGAQKSGTTYLHDLLYQTGLFAIPGKKEPHYFTTRTHISKDEYLNLYKGKEEKQILLDASTTYFCSRETSNQINSIFKEDKVIILMVVRDPIDRVRSAYFHSLKHGRELRKFDEITKLESNSYADIFEEETDKAKFARAKNRIFLKESDQVYTDPYFNFRYVSNSFYLDLLTPYLSNFENTFVINFNDLIGDPIKIKRAALKIVNRKTGSTSNTFSENQNSTKLSYKTGLKRLSENLKHEHSITNTRPGPLNNVAIYVKLLKRVYEARNNRTTTIEQFDWVDSARTQYHTVLSQHNLLSKLN